MKYSVYRQTWDENGTTLDWVLMGVFNVVQLRDFFLEQASAPKGIRFRIEFCTSGERSSKRIEKEHGMTLQ